MSWMRRFNSGPALSWTSLDETATQNLVLTSPCEQTLS